MVQTLATYFRKGGSCVFFVLRFPLMTCLILWLHTSDQVFMGVLLFISLVIEIPWDLYSSMVKFILVQPTMNFLGSQSDISYNAWLYFSVLAALMQLKMWPYIYLIFTSGVVNLVLLLTELF